MRMSNCHQMLVLRHPQMDLKPPQMKRNSRHPHQELSNQKSRKGGQNGNKRDMWSRRIIAISSKMHFGWRNHGFWDDGLTWSYGLWIALFNEIPPELASHSSTYSIYTSTWKHLRPQNLRRFGSYTLLGNKKNKAGSQIFKSPRFLDVQNLRTWRCDFSPDVNLSKEKPMMQRTKKIEWQRYNNCQKWQNICIFPPFFFP